MKTTVYIISMFFLISSAAFFFYPAIHAPSVPGLTEIEREWLDAHDGKIRLAHTPDWPPMDFLDNEGKPSGMAADYIKLIEEKLKFKFRLVPVCSWSKMLELAKAGDIDVISAGQETPERRVFMTWSTPFLNLKTTIIVQKGKYGDLRLDRMQGMKIAVIRAYAVTEFIRKQYPDLTLVEVINSKKGIEKVSFGELDAMIAEVPNALYIIETEKITNLSLAGDTGFKLHHGMGIRRDWPIFSRIIEKTLISISEEERRAIYGRWVKLDTPGFYLSRTFWYWFLGSMSAGLLMTGVVLFWNRALKREVAQRTEALRVNEIGLEALLALNETPHKSVQDIVEFSFRQMLDLTQSQFGYLTLEDQEGITDMVENRNGELPGLPVTVQVFSSGFEEDTKGFWGDVVKKRKAIISNDYQLSNPGLKGVPEAHKAIIRYMNVPILNHGRIVVVAGMGNKESDYTRSDLRQLNLLAHGMWRLIQRKKAEQAMQKSEKRFQDLVENTPNGIAIVQDNLVVHQNANQAHLMGDINFMAPDADHRFHEEDLPKVNSFFAQIRNGSLKESEVNFRFYSGEFKGENDPMTWVACIATPIDYHDRNAFLLIFIDMTESKRLTRLLTIQDKMASLGHVSAGIAHEIRNPLSGINIYLGTIEKYFRNPDKSEKIASSIEAIRSASGKIESVIKRVMNFAKPGEPRFATININEPVKEAVKLTRFTMNKKGIDIKENLAEGMSDCIAETHLIEELALNLINNAADAILEQGLGGVIRISSRQENEKILIRVEDDGPGIPRDIRQKIFDPFFTTKSHSTGIGLSLCHRIITDHNGRLDIGVSELGGACFLVELPLSGDR